MFFSRRIDPLASWAGSSARRPCQKLQFVQPDARLGVLTGNSCARWHACACQDGLTVNIGEAPTRVRATLGDTQNHADTWVSVPTILPVRQSWDFGQVSHNGHYLRESHPFCRQLDRFVLCVSAWSLRHFDLPKLVSFAPFQRSSYRKSLAHMACSNCLRGSTAP